MCCIAIVIVNFFVIYFFLGVESQTFSISHVFLFFMQMLTFQFVYGILLLIFLVLEYQTYFNQTLKIQLKNPINISETLQIIENTSKFSLLICDILDNISICFSLFTLTLQMIQSRTEIVFVYAIYVFFREPTQSHANFLLFTMFSLLFVWPFSFTTVTISTKIKREGESTLEIIQEGIRSSTTEISPKIFKHFQVLSQQISHQSPAVNLSLFQIDMNFAYNYICDIFSSSIFFSQFYEFMK